MKTWIPIPEKSDFTIYNIPFGVFSSGSNNPRVGIAIGDHILDLVVGYEIGIFKNIDFEITVLENKFLNDFIALGKDKTTRVREIIQQELTNENSILKQHKNAFKLQKEAIMHLPVSIGDYTDFYSSIEHATNVGTMFRDPENALLPNWKHIPVAYHGRSSSIIVSGQNIYRPKGQVVLAGDETPVFKPTSRLDFELEMAYIIGKETSFGESVNIANAEEYIFGKVLFNDWSARDIQKWEYVPLGPFLAKNFASSISPWVVTLEALEPFKVQGQRQDTQVLPYLEYTGKKNYDIHLEVSIQPQNSKEHIVSKSNFKYMYWNMSQQIAHHTCNGCNINVGDMLASGTISGKEKNSYGSMLELTWAGKKPIKLSNGKERKFIEDHDTVIFRGFSKKDDIRIGFGELKTTVYPAKI